MQALRRHGPASVRYWLPQTAYGTDCSPDPAIQVTLSCLNNTVLFMIDNTTAVAYLSRQASRDTVPLPPQTAHIAGEANVLGDIIGFAVDPVGLTVTVIIHKPSQPHPS